MAWTQSVERCKLRRLVVAMAIAAVVLGGITGPALGDRFEIEGLRAPVAVSRDQNGIVHIFSANENDLALAQGWAHARDRLFQMDLFRRQASGTLTELFGLGEDGAVLKNDIEMRTLGLRRAAACSLELPTGCPFEPAHGLSRATKAALEAYARGVNAFVAANGAPAEYRALGAQFAEWTPLDSVTVAKGLAFELSFDLDDLQNTDALNAFVNAGKDHNLPFDGQKLFFEDLFRSAPFEPVAVIPSKTALSAGVAASPENGAAVRRDQEAAEVARGYLKRVRNVSMLKKAFNSVRLSRGSNAWVIGSARTKGRGALLANDPHLDLTAPPLFYPVHLSAPPGINIIGDGVAGVPFVLTGRNLHVACGITSIALDVTDFYQESVPPDPIIPIEEVFRDQNGTILETTTTFVLPRRNFGPLLSASLSVQYTGFSATRELDFFRMMMKTRNLNDVVNALRFFDVGSQCFICTDSAGKIGYFVAGEVPLRSDLQAGTVNGLPPFFIRDGANDWLPMEDPPEDQAVPYEILPFSEMPQVINPPEGYLVSANNDPLGLNFDNDPLNERRPGGGIYYLSSRFNPGIRAFRIKELLDRRLSDGRVGFDDMRNIQADVVLHDAEFFVSFIGHAYYNAFHSKNPILRALAEDSAVSEAVRRLRLWDRSTPTGVKDGYDAHLNDREQWTSGVESSVAATIYSVWRGQFIRKTIIRTLDDAGLGDFDPSSQQLLTAVKNLLDHPERGGVGASGLNFFVLPDGVPLDDDPAIRRDYLILASLKSALDLLKGRAFAPAFGGSANQDDYRWGRVHRLVIDHPLGDMFSLTGDRDGNPFRPTFENLPGLPVDGGLETVDAASHSSRANTLADFEFSQGPLRRFVTSLGGLGRTESSLPGGVSGDVSSPLFNNLLGPWLSNETFRWRQLPLKAVVPGDVVILTPRRSALP